MVLNEAICLPPHRTGKGSHLPHSFNANSKDMFHSSYIFSLVSTQGWRYSTTTWLGGRVLVCPPHSSVSSVRQLERVLTTGIQLLKVGDLGRVHWEKISDIKFHKEWSNNYSRGMETVSRGTSFEVKARQQNISTLTSRTVHMIAIYRYRQLSDFNLHSRNDHSGRVGQKYLWPPPCFVLPGGWFQVPTAPLDDQRCVQRMDWQ